MSRRTTRSTAAFEIAASVGSSLNAANGIAQSTIMHISSQYSHPAFSKVYLGANFSQNGKAYAGSSGAVPKPPKAPEKPLMPYMRYSRKVWDEVKANQPDLKLWEIGKIIGKMWRELPVGDKQLYIDEYDAEKLEYHEHLKFYHNSPAYQGYLQAKARAEAEAAENRAMDREESCMSIEAADDGGGDTDEGFSVKHVAAARFQRNHRLMQDICADSSIIPNGRGIVTEQRLNILRNQVQSLKRHQAKLQDELMDIEKTHALTKRKWKEQSNAFSVEMKRLRNMTPQEYYLECKKKQQQQINAAKETQAPAVSCDKEANADESQKSNNDDEGNVDSSKTEDGKEQDKNTAKPVTESDSTLEQAEQNDESEPSLQESKDKEKEETTLPNKTEDSGVDKPNTDAMDVIPVPDTKDNEETQSVKLSVVNDDEHSGECDKSNESTTSD